MGQVKKLNTVQVLVDAGMPVCARSLARGLGVQFGPTTLRRWRKGTGYRRTYAWLVLEASEKPERAEAC